MKRIAFFLLLATFAFAQKKSVNLPSSKVLLSPAPGNPHPVDSLPTAAVLSPDQRYLVLLNSGFGTQAGGLRQGLTVIDTASNASRFFPDDRLTTRNRQTYYLGLAFSGDGAHLYASFGSLTDPLATKAGSTGNGIAVYGFNDGVVTPERFLKIPPQPLPAGKTRARATAAAPAGTVPPFPAGLAVIAAHGVADRLLVAANLSDEVLLLDTSDGHILQRFDLSTSNWVPASYPYAVIVNRAGTRAWCSLWNASQVAELDLEKGTVARWIAVREPQSKIAPGSHPNALLLSPDESRLFVALANADDVAAIDVQSGKVEQYISTRLPGQTDFGAVPIALAQTGDGTRLFVANASADTVAVLSTKRANAAPVRVGGGVMLPGKEAATKPMPPVICDPGPCPPSITNAQKSPAAFAAAGHIPTEWYPTALAVKGDDLFIVSGKAQGTGPNGMSADNYEKREHPYIAWLLHGSVARVNIPSAVKNIESLTHEALQSNLMSGRANALPFPNGARPIKHVLYIIKENRTYDQLFGDIAEGNGDRSLVMYGEDVTPNHHALARQFGLLDNFYDSGEVSGDGHVWSNAAISSDYTEQNWQLNYRGKERYYDFEGRVMDETPHLQGIPDINEPASGYLWANAARHHLTYRNYGEFVPTTWCKAMPPTSPMEGPASSAGANCARQVVKHGEPLPSIGGRHEGEPSPWPWDVPLPAFSTPAKVELIGHANLKYPWFELDFPDQYRADIFLEEFQQWARDRGKGHDTMPALMTMSLSDDHTAGTSPGRPRPRASVADNDLALGRIVEAISHSSYWDDTAILVLEDDAQNGADHVDAHRSIALVISKYAPAASGKRVLVDHHFYTTVNMIHTAEVLLGLPPMNNNDAHAAVIAPLFSGAGNHSPYTADYRNRDNAMIYEANPPRAAGAAQSNKLDFSKPDAADAEVLNRILWRDAMGVRPYPKPKHTVIPARLKGTDGD